jgi:Domain of unknown function (DUF3303)
MRFILKVTLPADTFNKAVHDGTIGQKMGQILEETKPEAAYFTSMHGSRGGFLIINMNDTSEMPRFAEPWFLTFNADVEFLPVMTPQDLQRGGLDQLGKKWK